MKKRPSPPRSRPATGLCQNGSEPDAKQLLAALMAFKRGDFSARLPDDWTGVTGKIADTFNDVITTTQRMTRNWSESDVWLEKKAASRSGRRWAMCRTLGPMQSD